ncbi:MAG: hypothetical protein KJ018_14865, partial [Burkholderiales bacterium]|nr:hypothetical protein [Burkholderiales bacterium]
PWALAVSLKLANGQGRGLGIGVKGLFGARSTTLWDKSIRLCGLDAGKVGLKAGAKGGGLPGAAQISGTLTAEIQFAETFQYEYPILEIGWKQRTGGFSRVLGADHSFSSSRTSPKPWAY